jgi:hypothetical protein
MGLTPKWVAGAMQLGVCCWGVSAVGWGLRAPGGQGRYAAVVQGHAFVAAAAGCTCGECGGGER